MNPPKRIIGRFTDLAVCGVLRPMRSLAHMNGVEAFPVE